MTRLMELTVLPPTSSLLAVRRDLDAVPVANTALKGAFVLTVGDTSEIFSGDQIALSMNNPAAEAQLLAGLTPDEGWTALTNGMQVSLTPTLYYKSYTQHYPYPYPFLYPYPYPYPYPCDPDSNPNPTPKNL